MPKIFDVISVLTALSFVLFLVLYPRPAVSHSWYDADCCDRWDCAPAPEGAVRPVSGGYRVSMKSPVTQNWIDEFIAHNSEKIRFSRDEKFHVCIPYEAVRCLYVPGGNS